jgi:hypothetical protein
MTDFELFSFMGRVGVCLCGDRFSDILRTDRLVNIERAVGTSSPKEQR